MASMDLCLFRDDGFNRLLKLMRLPSGGVRRTAIMACLCWGMLLLLTLVTGSALRQSMKESFLLDYAAYSQFLLGLAVLLMGEDFIEERMRFAHNEFHFLVADPKRLAGAVAMVGRWRRAILPDVFLILVAIACTWLWLYPDEIAAHKVTWRSYGTQVAGNLNIAGWWYGLVSYPVFTYIWLRWAWRILLWAIFLFRIRRTRLCLAALHPDRAGGLAFLGHTQACFGIPMFAFGVVAVASVLYRYNAGYASLEDWSVIAPIVAYAVLSPVLFFVPLLAFTGQLYKAKQEDLLRLDKFSHQFLGRLDKDNFFGPEQGDPEKASVIMEGLSSLQKSHLHALSMRTVPFDLKSFGSYLAAAGSPMIPVIARLLPWPGATEFLRSIGF